MGPRALALLAVVAAAGQRGITRDRILGILWAETEEEQARHTLAQTIYLLRRGSGREWLAGSSSLRLHDEIGCDVRSFLEAVANDDFERAAALYAGPFLDGFYLSGAPEFEVWAEETRTQLRFTASRVLETLARRAEEQGDFRLAGQWWRGLTALDPYSAVYARGLIEAVSAAGDASGALGFALEYERRVRRELESEPDAAVRERIAQLRVARASSPRSTPTQSAPPPGPAADGAAEAGTGAGAALPSARPRRRLLVPLGSAATLAAVAFAWVLASRAASASAPFLAVGLVQVSDTVVRGTVFRDMLATNLARTEGLRVVANSRLLELLPRGGEGIAGATADAARRAGANELLEGELGVMAGGLVLTLRRVSLPTGIVRRGYTVQAADAYALTDSATAAIARDLHLELPADAVSSVRTRSDAAYALYEEGLRALYGGDPGAALHLMEAALARDSLFAMAAYFGWMSARNVRRYPVADRLLPIARRLAVRMGDRERLWIQSALAQQHDPLAETLALAREFAARFPDDPDALDALGSALWASGDWPGSVAAFNRSIAIDSAAGATSSRHCRVCSVASNLAVTYLWWDSAAAAERTARRLIAFRPEEPGGWQALLEPLLRQGRRDEAEAAAATASALAVVPLDHRPPLDRDRIRSGRADELTERLASELGASTAIADERAWLLTFSLRNQGRLRDAERLATRGLVPGGRVPLARPTDAYSAGIIALERGRPRDAARGFLDMASNGRPATEPRGFEARQLAFQLTLAGTALAAAGDTAAVRTLADSVERIGASSSFGRDPRLHFFLRGLLLQQQNRHAEAIESFRRSLFSATEGYTRTNLELARSLMQLGRYRDAVAALRPALRGGVDGSNTYVTHSELREALARAYYAAGQRDSAAVQYALVERAWRNADPEFAERYREARSRARGL